MFNTICHVKMGVPIFHLILVVTEYLISEIANPLCFHADIFCRSGAC